MLARALLPLTLLALVACVYGDDTQWKTTLRIARKDENLPKSASTTINDGKEQHDGTCVWIVSVNTLAYCNIWRLPGLKVEVVGNIGGPAQLELIETEYYPLEALKVIWKPKDLPKPSGKPLNRCRGLKVHVNYKCILEDDDGQANKGQAQNRVPNFPNFP